MGLASQILPVACGGILGSVFNSAVGFHKIGVFEIPARPQGFVWGALSGIATSIIQYRRYQLITGSPDISTEKKCFINVTAYALSVLSWHGARYVCNNYLNMMIAKKVVVVTSVGAMFLSVPCIIFQTCADPDDLIEEFI